MGVSEDMMRLALEQARLALDEGEMPVGAVVADGVRVVALGHNRRERAKDPTAHAEIVALRCAARAVGDWRLSGLTLYVTLEPCPMCAGAIVLSRVERVVFGAYDRAAGCAGSVYRLTEDRHFNHFAPAEGGVLEAECAALIDRFFRGNRRESQR